jgi:membrane-bound hydrogenase subunit mbhJ
VDEVIREVDPDAIIAYVPGCPPKPEAMIAGAAKALATL